ncbi:MAG: hypothetical protein LBQ14_00480 [Treponema sp.]|nr:hypothetical protein [Treponema sp.]
MNCRIRPELSSPKKIFALGTAVLLALTVFAGAAAAQVKAEKKGNRSYFYAGGGIELSQNSLLYYAMSEVASITYDVNDLMAVGFKVTMSENFGGTVVAEPGLYYRLYVAKFLWGRVFAQFDLGASYIMDDEDMYPEPLMGVSAGVRFPFLGMFYAEPYLRFGYPYMWGLGVTGGIRF